jgi:hypothetical protein
LLLIKRIIKGSYPKTEPKIYFDKKLLKKFLNTFVNMDSELKLFMVLLGCTPNGRLTEQHDIFFGIGNSVTELVDDMYRFWPDGGRLHIDSWREVTYINGYAVAIVSKSEATATDDKLFFLNLGGYRPGEFEEYHYKTLVVANSMAEAVKQAKKSTFYKHYNIKGGGASHIDDKYALDVDDMYNVEDILAPHLKERFSINISKVDEGTNDELHIGYLKLKV